MGYEAPNGSILQEDIERIASDLSSFAELNNKSFFITGASGLIGSLLVKALLCLNRRFQYNVTILALVRSRQKAEEVFGELLHDSNLRLVVGDVLQLPDITGAIDYIIHGASITSSRQFVEQPVETILTAINGTNNVLQLARSKTVSGMVYLSSLEVYGTIHSDKPVGEDEYGMIDPLSVRSSYSESKRMAENLCCSYAAEYDVPVRIARLTQTFGAGVSYEDNRVFAQFARSVIEQNNIVLHTKGSTVRNYCYTSDAVRALFYILLRGTAGDAYNVANKDTGISIADMAELTARMGSNTNLVFELDHTGKFGYNPDMKICLDTGKLNRLGWSAEVELPEMFRRLIASMSKKRAIRE